MARKTVVVTITADGRDNGKSFLITEMSSRRAEQWGARALNAMAKASGDMAPELLRSGMAGLTAAALSAFARSHFDEIQPLMAEMFTCIQVLPKPGDTSIVRPLLDDDVNSDIEEVSTRIKLREEVLELHLGFFKAAVNWILTAAKASLEVKPAKESTPHTRTSRKASAPLSRQD